MKYIYQEPLDRTIHPGKVPPKTAPAKSSLKQPPLRDDMSSTDANTSRSSVDRRNLRTTFNSEREREIFEYSETSYSDSNYSETESKHSDGDRKIVKVYRTDSYDDYRGKRRADPRLRRYHSSRDSRSAGRSYSSTYSSKYSDTRSSTYSTDTTSYCSRSDSETDDLEVVSNSPCHKVIRHIQVPQSEHQRHIPVRQPVYRRAMSDLTQSDTMTESTRTTSRRSCFSDPPTEIYSVPLPRKMVGKKLVKIKPKLNERIIVQPTDKLTKKSDTKVRSRPITTISTSTDFDERETHIVEHNLSASQLRPTASSKSKTHIVEHNLSASHLRPTADTKVAEVTRADNDLPEDQNLKTALLANRVSESRIKPTRTVGVQMETKYSVQRPEAPPFLEKRRDIKTQTRKQETKFPKETAYLTFGEWQSDTNDEDDVEVVAIRKPDLHVESPRKPIQFVTPIIDYRQPRTPTPPPTPPRIPTPPPLRIPPSPGPQVLIRVGGGWMREEHHRIQHKPLHKHMKPTADGLPFVKSAYVHSYSKQPVVIKHKKDTELRYASFIP